MATATTDFTRDGDKCTGRVSADFGHKLKLWGFYSRPRCAVKLC